MEKAELIIHLSSKYSHAEAAAFDLLGRIVFRPAFLFADAYIRGADTIRCQHNRPIVEKLKAVLDSRDVPGGALAETLMSPEAQGAAAYFEEVERSGSFMEAISTALGKITRVELV